MTTILIFLLCLVISSAVVALAICRAAAAGDRAMEEYFKMVSGKGGQA